MTLKEEGEAETVGTRSKWTKSHEVRKGKCGREGERRRKEERAMGHHRPCHCRLAFELGAEFVADSRALVFPAKLR